MTWPNLLLRKRNEDRARFVEVLKLRAQLMASPEGNKALFLIEWNRGLRRIRRRQRR